MTAADTVAYTFGAKSEMQGSGVFKSLVLKDRLQDRVVGLAITGALVYAFVATAVSKGYITLPTL